MHQELLSVQNHKKDSRPVTILQYGEGNFLRAFADSFIQTLNDTKKYNGSIAVVKPTNRGTFEKFNAQDCLYTVVTRGISGGETLEKYQVVDSIKTVLSPYDDYETYLTYARLDTLKIVISNTTEAGIVFSDDDKFEDKPAATFPGKLTQFLYERFYYFKGAKDKGLVLLPTELIDANGDILKACVLRFIESWELPAEFKQWVLTACTFANTLVDRIVSGYPADNDEEFFVKLGYKDKLLTVAEPFGLWIIEADATLRERILPGSEDLPIIFTDNQKPFKERKVRILNGAHTSFAMLAFLCGMDYVKEAMADDNIRTYVEHIIYKEVIPCLSLSENELTDFAAAVFERFENPFVKHALMSISLNSVSKWRARCMPSLIAYEKEFHRLPEGLTFSLAALLKFYKENSRDSDGRSYQVTDDASVLEFFKAHKSSCNHTLVRDYLAQIDFNGQDLNNISGLCQAVTSYLDDMDAYGVNNALLKLLDMVKDNE